MRWMSRQGGGAGGGRKGTMIISCDTERMLDETVRAPLGPERSLNPDKDGGDPSSYFCLISH